MQATIYHHGIVLFDSCLTDDICDQLIEYVSPVINLPALRNDHLTIGYNRGTRYSEAPLDIENSDVFKRILANHIDELKTAYFKLMNITEENGITSFNDPMIKKYSTQSNDQFTLHFDSGGKSIKRSLSMIWYLCDVEEGGETVFPQAGVEIVPKKGCCLVFPPFWNYPHLARNAKSNDKYTLNSFGSIV